MQMFTYIGTLEHIHSGRRLQIPKEQGAECS